LFNPFTLAHLFSVWWLEILSKSHYIRKAEAENWWFDFTQGEVLKYCAKFGDKFCMVLCGKNDVYIMPYYEVASLFSENQLDDRKRWMGTIENGFIRISHGGKSISGSAYYNAYHLLDEFDPVDRELLALEVFEGEENNTDLQKKIRAYNDRYSTTSPHKQHMMSERIARPGSIADYLKKLNEHKCQICREEGFLQANGTRYIEAHHIIELHRLISGSYCSNNVIIVCPTCHRMLHYANVSYEIMDAKNVNVIINGEVSSFARNVVQTE